MSEFILDLTDYKETTSAHIPEGNYTVVVEDAETTTSTKVNADTGKPSPGVILYLRVLDGEYAGATLVDRLWITPKSRFRIVGFMQAIGLPTPRKKLKVNLKHFIGQTLNVAVEDGEPYNGRVKSEVRGFFKAERAAAAEAAPEPDIMDTVADEAPAAEVTEPAPVEQSAPAQASPAPSESVAVDEPESVDLETLDLG